MQHGVGETMGGGGQMNTEGVWDIGLGLSAKFVQRVYKKGGP